MTQLVVVYGYTVRQTQIQIWVLGGRSAAGGARRGGATENSGLGADGPGALKRPELARYRTGESNGPAVDGLVYVADCGRPLS